MHSSNNIYTSIGVVNNKIEVKFLKTHPDAQLPTKAYEEDNCFDLYGVEDVIVPNKSSAIVPVGLTCAYITPGFGFVVRPRSGLGFKAGLQPHLGEIDNGYRNDLAIKIYNFSYNDYAFKKGDRIAQIKIEKVWDTEVSFVEEIISANRGAAGIGSSGN